MPDDIALLKDYAETNPGPAFAELVSRHPDLDASSFCVTKSFRRC